MPPTERVNPLGFNLLVFGSALCSSTASRRPKPRTVDGSGVRGSHRHLGGHDATLCAPSPIVHAHQRRSARNLAMPVPEDFGPTVTLCAWTLHPQPGPSEPFEYKESDWGDTTRTGDTAAAPQVQHGGDASALGNAAAGSLLRS